MTPFLGDETGGKSFILADCRLKPVAAMVRSARHKAISLHTGILFTQQSDNFGQMMRALLIGVVGSGTHDVLKPVGRHFGARRHC